MSAYGSKGRYSDDDPEEYDADARGSRALAKARSGFRLTPEEQEAVAAIDAKINRLEEIKRRILLSETSKDYRERMRSSELKSRILRDETSKRYQSRLDRP